MRQGGMVKTIPYVAVGCFLCFRGFRRNRCSLGLQFCEGEALVDAAGVDVKDQTAVGLMLLDLEMFFHLK